MNWVGAVTALASLDTAAGGSARMVVVFVIRSSLTGRIRSPSNRGRLLTGPLVPPVEGREIARVPRLAESRRAQIPVRANLARDGPQVVPEVDDRRTAPEPVAVVD